MLGKLLKYELKASARSFVPLYLGIIIASILLSFTANGEMDIVSVTLGVLTGGLFIALMMVTIIVIIQRFRKNLLGDEGYLMFTLPVGSKILIISKCLSSVIYSVLSTIVSIIAMFIIIFNATGAFEGQYFGELSSIWQEIVRSMPDILMFTLVMLLSLITMILSIYLALSIGQLPPFNEHRVLTAFIAYFGIGIVVNLIQALVAKVVPALGYMNSLTGNYAYNYGRETFHLFNDSQMWVAVGWTVLEIALYFFATSYILDKKLNLE
ncbi:MAG: ABC transporter permease [Clostridioides sp.]|jgi:hypothetical protein|nr:ABC transporter permease [Clostridioides sp.]